MKATQAEQKVKVNTL